MNDDPLLTTIAGTLGIALSEVSEISDMANTRKWDSLRQIMLMTELETKYNVTFTDEEMLESTSVSKIRELLRRRGTG